MYDNEPRFDLWTDLRSLEGALAGEHRARAAVSIAHSQELSLAPAVPAHPTPPNTGYKGEGFSIIHIGV